MKKITTLAILGATFALGACQPATLYNWGAYDAKLLAYYKDAAHIDAFEAELFALIEQGEVNGKRVPPGIYAEYGFLQMQKGDNETAKKFFALEKDHWPEAKVLMDTMIRAAGGKTDDDKADNKEMTDAS